ncbi:hypothetical protein BHM03_00011903 [Ensete ventricosum]|nr:hypothetical protein BHM03_00011903 [Ensete ventricosum]
MPQEPAIGDIDKAVGAHSERITDRAAGDESQETEERRSRLPTLLRAATAIVIHRRARQPRNPLVARRMGRETWEETPHSRLVSTPR